MILYNGKPVGLGQAWYAPYPYIRPPQGGTVEMSPASYPPPLPPPGPGEPGGPPLTQAGLQAQLREQPGAAAGGGTASATPAAEGFPVVPAVLVGVAALVAAIIA